MLALSVLTLTCLSTNYIVLLSTVKISSKHINIKSMAPINVIMAPINVITKMEIKASAAAGWELFGEKFGDHSKWVS